MSRTEVHNAIVTRNTDEALGVQLRGAVFFEAPTLFEGEYPQPALPSFPFASALGAGMFYVPKVGDEIEVMIKVDDPSNPHDTTDAQLPEPRWIAMVYSDVAEIFTEFQKNYPFRMGWVSNSGHHLIFDDTEGEELVRFAHTIGSFFEMDRTGDWTEQVQRNKIISIFGDKTSEIQKTKRDLIGGNHEIEIRKDKIELIKGNYTLEVLGDYIFKHQGNLENEVNELKQTLGALMQTIRGQRAVNVDGGNSDIIGGADTRAVLANQNTTISGLRNTLVAQADEQTYGLGSKETIVTLDKAFDILLGNFKVNIVAGNFDFTTLAGLVALGNALGKFEVDIAGGTKMGNLLGNVAVDPAGNVTLAGLAMTNLNGALVVVNSGVGPVLTQLTAPIIDNITGAPQIGVPTFLA